MTGTPYYIAPEILDEDSGMGSCSILSCLILDGYRQGVDIWSLGITAIELAEGAPPHSHLEPMRVLAVVASKPPPQLREPDEWSEEFNDFLAQALIKDPAGRPTADELLAVCKLA